MKNLSDYLPLLIILASVLFSFIRGPKKGKKENLPTPTQYPVENEVFKNEILNEIVVSSKKSKPEPATHLKEKPASKPRSIAPEIVENPNSLRKNLSDPDEIKKAIIYTEIFGRKEY